MKPILLVIPADRQVTRAIAAALDLAAARTAPLHAAVVLDTDASDRLTSRMMNVGLAEKVSDQVSETLTREHHVRGEALLAEVTEQAQARGLACRTTLESGDPGEVCQRLAVTTGAAVAVFVIEKRSWIARLLAGGEPIRPPMIGDCEIMLVDED